LVKNNWIGRKQLDGRSLGKETKVRDSQVHSQKSEVSFRDFLSTKIFLVKAYFKEISQRFSKENFKQYGKRREKIEDLKMLLKPKKCYLRTRK